MNQVQEAVARVLGMNPGELDELQEQVSSLTYDNQLLNRQLEDLNYINLYDVNRIQEVVNPGDRRPTILRIRRLRQDNPIAKQSVKLIVRFTLGRGIQYVVTADPTKTTKPNLVATNDPRNRSGSNDNYDPSNLSVPSQNGSTPSSVVVKEASSSSSGGISEEPAQVSGPEYEDTTDPVKLSFEEFWTDPDNALIFTKPESMKEWLDELVTDGEKFFVGFESSASPYLKLTEIPIEEITTIIYSTDNWKRPVYYRRQWQPMKFNGDQGTWETDGSPRTQYYLDYRVTDAVKAEWTKGITIPASKLAPPDQKVYHTFINPVWSRIGRRGISELFASREWFRVFKEFMEDRAAINKAATSIAYKRKIKGGPSSVAQFTGSLGGLQMTSTENPSANANLVRKLTRPTSGAVYDSNASADLEWMKTDTGAVNAKEDGAAILMSAGAGVAINAHFFGQGGDGGMAAAQVMELPMVKSFEDWQNFIFGICMELTYWVLRLASNEDQAKKDLERFSFSFPPIISQDVVKWTTAWSQVVQSIAPGNQVVQEQAIRSILSVLGVTNIDALIPRIVEENNRAELEKQAKQQAMLDAIKQNPAGVPVPGGNGAVPPPRVPGPQARDGNANGIDPRLRRIAAGRIPPPPPSGRQPPR